uniref:Uncharacterized protein n=1 Tax=Guillardia theta TaxID=55529 RepID=A0A7S4N5D5_GUITH|mmetsp:Transcript_17078/g.56626  ORF Transcript_17078/g.56626 Transcript_17078/m.56626 type:complete len:440 (+) Transcript_17078:143-1462(+)
MPKNQLARGRDLNRKKARDKQNALVTREQTKKLLDILDPLIPQMERSLGELRGSLPSRRTLLHLLEDLVTHLRAMPASSRASRKERKPGVSLEEATARVMSSRRERIVSVELPSWRIKCGSVGLEGYYVRSPLRKLEGQCFLHLVENESLDVLRATGRAVMRGKAVGPFFVDLRTFSREGMVCLNVIRCRVIPAHVSCKGEGVFVLEAQEEAEVRHAWPGDLVGKFCMVVRRDPGTSNACAYDIDQALRGLVSESRVPMMEALKVLSTDHASQSIMERVRGSMQSIGRAFMVYMARLTETHLSLGMDEENNLFVNYCIRMRLPQLVGGFKSNWKRVMKMALNGEETELSGGNTKVYGYLVNNVGGDSLFLKVFYLHSSTGICYFSRSWVASSAGLLQSVRVFRDGSDEESPRHFYINMVKVAEEDRSLLATLEEPDNDR